MKTCILSPYKPHKHIILFANYAPWSIYDCILRDKPKSTAATTLIVMVVLALQSAKCTNTKALFGDNRRQTRAFHLTINLITHIYIYILVYTYSSLLLDNHVDNRKQNCSNFVVVVVVKHSLACSGWIPRTRVTMTIICYLFICSYSSVVHRRICRMEKGA